MIKLINEINLNNETRVRMPAGKADYINLNRTRQGDLHCLIKKRQNNLQ